MQEEEQREGNNNWKNQGRHKNMWTKEIRQDWKQ